MEVGKLWTPDFAPIWKHHYTDRALEGAEIHVFSPFGPTDPDRRGTESAQMEALYLYTPLTAAIQLRQQWPGAFDGSLERTVRKLVPRLRQDARIIFTNKLDDQKVNVATLQVCI